ncbi:hypothetical protein GCM10007916_35640 [Psychromonas marina]|uniref:Uncharacterized protein n=1 Tax=Psychromonas marina TaxID=88364 RepID=A0ABQ6E508_9GAMM|nr:hypothetical protein GCM10007916_35640 [Psychromonas marina]
MKQCKKLLPLLLKIKIGDNDENKGISTEFDSICFYNVGLYYSDSGAIRSGEKGESHDGGEQW